jgi:hypothetical protein
LCHLYDGSMRKVRLLSCEAVDCTCDLPCMLVFLHDYVMHKGLLTG